MNLTLNRIFKGPTYTIGRLFIDGQYFCDTLEDKDRGLTQNTNLSEINRRKIKHVTAIPTGTYDITLNIRSPKYSNFARYNWAKKYDGYIPRLLDVPGFDGILIHPGNHEAHTSGCILVGQNKIKGKVINSVNTWSMLMEKLLKSSENISITIR